MNIHDMTEVAYKNGYEAGKKEAQAEIERLQTRNDELNVLNKIASQEAIKSFENRLYSYLDVGHLRPPTEKCFSEIEVRRMIERIGKEFTEQRGEGK